MDEGGTTSRTSADRRLSGADAAWPSVAPANAASSNEISALMVFPQVGVVLVSSNSPKILSISRENSLPRSVTGQILGARLPGPSDDVFITRKLLGAHGAPGVNASGRDTDLRSHAKLAAVRILGGCIVHDDRAVKFR